MLDLEGELRMEGIGKFEDLENWMLELGVLECFGGVNWFESFEVRPFLVGDLVVRRTFVCASNLSATKTVVVS